MSISLRLFIILAILLLVVPAIFKKTPAPNANFQTEVELGSPQNYQADTNNLTNESTNINRDGKSTLSKNASTNQLTHDGEKLKASISTLGLRDEGLINCVTSNLSRYFDVRNLDNVIQDASEMTSLICHRSNIKSLNGIEVLSNLTYLSLSDNDELTDLSPLVRLSNLESLDLDYASENIENIEVLQNLNNLKKISFPNMPNTYCYQAEKVVKNMQWHHDTIKHNLNQTYCRGQNNQALRDALFKQKRGEELSEKQLQLIEDYEENERWRN